MEEKGRGVSSLQSNRKGCGCQGPFKETMKGRKGGPLNAQFVSLETFLWDETFFNCGMSLERDTTIYNSRTLKHERFLHVSILFALAEKK